MSFVSDVRDAVGAAFCSGFNTYDRAARWTANLVYPDRVDEVYPLSPAGQIANSGLALFCDRPPMEPPTPEFTGGQCALAYAPSGTYVINCGPSTGETRQWATIGQATGPVLGVALIDGGWSVQFAGGVTRPCRGIGRSFSLTSAGPGTSVACSQLGSDSFDDAAKDVKITAAGPVGHDDSCGDQQPPPPIPLPQPDRTFPININNNSGQVVFGNGNLNVNGDLVAPFTLVAGNLFLTGAIALNTGEINLNFGGQPTEPIEPGITAKPDDDTGEGDEGDEEEGPSNIIGAVVIASPAVAGQTEIFQPDAPNIFPPKIGHLSFKIKIGSRFHWTSDINIKNQNNFIHNPTVLPAVRVVAHPQPGWAIEVTPVRGIIPNNDIVLI